MAVRTDVTVNFTPSPRVIRIGAPSTEITVQDLHDTLRTIEARVENLDESRLIASAGKEDLGGEVRVGITSTLQDAQLEFEPRFTILSAGSVTTADVDGETLIDSAATFVTDGVVRGDIVQNVTDGSFGSVLSVDSETQITHTILEGGTENDWDLSDSYSIYDLVQCDISGGNLVAIDNNGVAITPILPSFGTHVVRTSSSSATLQESDAIQFSSYRGEIAIDVNSGNSGTEFPLGTLQKPVDNLADALLIANQRGINRLFLISDLTISSGNTSNKIFVGLTPKTVLTISATVTTTNSQYERLTLRGTIPDVSSARDCIIDNLSFSGDLLEDCLILGTISLTGSNDIALLRCIDNDPSLNEVIFDFTNFTGTSVLFRDVFGGFKCINVSDPNLNVAFDIRGRVILDSTITAGAFIVRGIGEVTDNSTGTTLKTDNLVSAPLIAAKKNIALANFQYVLRDSSTKQPKTGVTGITEEIAKDGNSFVALTNSSVEVGNGVYRVDLTANEMNADTLSLRFSATDVDDTIVSVVTAK